MLHFLAVCPIFTNLRVSIGEEVDVIYLQDYSLTKLNAQTTSLHRKIVQFIEKALKFKKQL